MSTDTQSPDPTLPAARVRAAGGSPFEKLTTLVAASGTSGAELCSRLRRLGGPSTVDRLLRAVLVAAVRRGPAASAEGWGPARLLATAERAAGCGAAPAGTAAAIRTLLEELETRLHEETLWDPEVPLWWRPLPEAGALEALWTELDRQESDRSRGDGGLAEALGEPQAVEAALGAPEGAGWLHLPDALGSALTDRIHRELTDADRTGSLELTRGGVGSYDLSSPARTDRVAYVTGFEPELLAAAPAAAVLVQWLLARLPVLLPGNLRAPGSAMLARYPAPSRGFVPHLDNPGGEDDNGRALSVVTYLTGPQTPCMGGEIAVWTPVGSSREATSEAPPEVLPPTGGSMVLFDSRRVLHEVRPLDPGPDRWTLVTWLSDVAEPRALGPEPPVPTPAEVLEPLDGVPSPEGRVLFRGLSLTGASPAGSGSPGSGLTIFVAPSSDRSTVEGATEPSHRVGIVCTTHRAGPELERWLCHHLALGFGRLIVALDSVAGPDVAERAVKSARRLDGSGRIVVWTPEEAAKRRLAALGEWNQINGPDGNEGGELLVAGEGGTATDAVAARQALHATAALAAARSGDFGSAEGCDGGSGEVALDWLLHLDVDELFYLEGTARGGATVSEHFVAASRAGLAIVRYVNHELLLPAVGGRQGTPFRFKVNPALAAARLGPVGWRRLVEALGIDQEGVRPYFRAYWNGKAAVSVAAGGAAGGVHGWRLRDEHTGRERAEVCVAGPSILHLHLPTPEAFRAKYLPVAASGRAGDGRRAFPPSPLEERAVELIRSLREEGASADAVRERLDRLYREALCSRPEEIDLLEEAGLVFSPDLPAWTG